MDDFNSLIEYNGEYQETSLQFQQLMMTNIGEGANENIIRIKTTVSFIRISFNDEIYVLVATLKISLLY